MNAKLYIATRDWKLSILLMYIWESVEFGIVSQFTDKFSEMIDDSLLGDPIIGITIILALYFIDYHTGWDIDFRKTVPNWIRFIEFITTGFVLTILGTINDHSAAIVLAIGVAYIAITLIFYGYYLFKETIERQLVAMQREAKKSVALWLGIVIILMAVVAPNEVPLGEFPYNTYMRVIFVESTVFMAALIVIVTSRYLPTAGDKMKM